MPHRNRRERRASRGRRSDAPPPPTMPTIADRWALFAAMVVPKGASAAQVSDLRSAYYAGAYGYHSVMQHIGDNPLISEEQGCAIMERLEAELEGFFEREMAEGTP